MNKILKIFIICFTLLPLSGNVFASEIEGCTSSEAWNRCITAIGDKMEGVIIGANEELTQEYLDLNKLKIRRSLGENILKFCSADLMNLMNDNVNCIELTHNDKAAIIEVVIPELMKEIKIASGILLYDKKLNIGDVLTVDGISKQLEKDGRKYFWDKSCSDYVIWENLSDNAGVNIAGQKMWGTKNEYFLDFPKGKSKRAFPGLVLKDVTFSTTEEIVTYNDFISGKEVVQKFAAELDHTQQCKNMYTYLVALDVTNVKAGGVMKNTYAVVSSITGGIMGYTVGTAAIAGIGAGGLAATGVALAAVPVAGWIVGGVLLVGAGVMALVPTTIRDINQVIILAGPYAIP